MRMASLIGRTTEGKLISLGVAEDNDIDRLCAMRSRIISDGGLLNKGKDKEEVHLTEIRLLSNATAGGELKGAHRFLSPEQVKSAQARTEARQKIIAAARAKAEAEAKKAAAPAPTRAELLKAKKINVNPSPVGSAVTAQKK